MKKIQVSAFGVPVFFDEYRRVAVQLLTDAGVSATVLSRDTWVTGRGCESRSHEERAIRLEHEGRSVVVHEIGGHPLGSPLSVVLGAVSGGTLWMVNNGYSWDDGSADAVAEVLGPGLVERIRVLHEAAAAPARAHDEERTRAMLARPW